MSSPIRSTAKVHLQLIAGTRELKHQSRVTACRLDKPRDVTRRLEGSPDMLGDLRQRGCVASCKVKVLRWTVQELMRTHVVPTRPHAAGVQTVPAAGPLRSSSCPWP